MNTKSTNLVDSLRTEGYGYPSPNLFEQAADEIEGLRGLLQEWLCASDNFDLEDWARRVRNKLEDDSP